MAIWRRAFRLRNFESVGRQIIAGAEAASAAKSPVAGEKHIGAPPDGGSTEGRRMGLSHGHLSALRVPRRGSHLLFPPYPGLREPVGSLAPRYTLSPSIDKFW